MARSILELGGLAATLLFAVPVAMFGADLLLRGRPVGLVFLVLAVAMVAVEEYLLDPTDLPGRAVERLVRRFVKLPEGEGEDGERDDTDR